MGLVDNLTGMLYYINAEHPFTVLYRKGKATFLEQELELRKLGMPEQEEQFRVRTMQLLAEDVLIAGSDGRDDIVIRNPQTGEEKVNDDEFLFLKHVEQADGLLDGIIDRLKASGTVLDDISLLRLSYRENNPAPIAHIPVEIRETIADAQRLVEAGRHEEVLARLEDLFAANRSLPELLKTLGAIYFHKQEYARAAECFESYLEEVPSDNEYIYALSNVYRLGG
ncbi:MAG TPA: SpoIIE family protein phosphatase, partial [Leptospiraceae bacterium]|nr:SpoIIE family protein phosphatase [Leptospiraceae bacterium]